MRTVALLILLSLTACNFHEIDAGKYFRSAQLDAGGFRSAIGRYGIKTIINLRGARPGEDWYDGERAVASELQVLQIDIPMSSRRLPHKRDLILLLDAFKNAPRPLLVHCLIGADRTGEASAIYEMIYMGKSKEDSLKMLAPEFFHSPEITPAKSYFIRELWQGEAWARTQYNPCSGQYKYYNPNTPECFDDGHKTIVPADEDT